MGKKIDNVLNARIDNPLYQKFILGVLMALLMTVLYAFATDIYKLPRKNSEDIGELKSTVKVQQQRVDALECNLEKSYQQIQANQKEIIEMIKARK